MRFLYKRIHHFFSSNSRHGTHSPFVYKLANDIIYRKRNRENRITSKSAHLISEIASFYNKELFYTHKKKDLNGILVIEANQFSSLDIDEDINNYFIIILKDPYNNKKVEQCWNLVQQNPNVTITIDLFHFGMIMKRKEQPKENFKLRFPY